MTTGRAVAGDGVGFRSGGVFNASEVGPIFVDSIWMKFDQALSKFRVNSGIFMNVFLAENPFTGLFSS